MIGDFQDRNRSLPCKLRVVSSRSRCRRASERRKRKHSNDRKQVERVSVSRRVRPIDEVTSAGECAWRVRECEVRVIKK